MVNFTSWDGVKAYFTFFDSPGMIDVTLILAILVTVFAVIATIKHENDSYIDYKD